MITARTVFSFVKLNVQLLIAVPLLSCRASLWSSCVVLPLLALTWMSAVLAITDRRSALFQILFAVFDSLEGFVIVMVHCILRREVTRKHPLFFPKVQNLVCEVLNSQVFPGT